jgi:hypothetical protein
VKDLHWPDERYVRIYTRDTPEWLALSFEAQALYALIHRKADRAGRIVLGRQGAKGVAVILHRVEKWQSVLEPALNELITDGFVTISDGILTIPDFVKAQEAVTSGRARQQKYREARKAEAAAAENEASSVRDEASPGDETSAGSDAGVQHGTAQHGMEGMARHGGHGTALEEGDDEVATYRPSPTRPRVPFWDDEDWSFQMREPLSAQDAGVFDRVVTEEAAQIRMLPERERVAAEAAVRRRIEARFNTKARGASR